MRSARIHRLVLMIKYTSKTMYVMDKLLIIRFNYKKKTVILITTQKSFFVKHVLLIFFLARADVLQAY